MVKDKNTKDRIVDLIASIQVLKNQISACKDKLEKSYLLQDLRKCRQDLNGLSNRVRFKV